MASATDDAIRHPVFRLAWRVMTAGGSSLPRYVVMSDDLADAATVKAHARLVGAEAFGTEFRVAHGGSPDIYTTAVEIDRWDASARPLPEAVATTLWEHGSDREAKATALRHMLRLALDEGVADGLLADADALGLRRAADLLIAGRLAA